MKPKRKTSRRTSHIPSFQLVVYPNPILKEISVPVEIFGKDIPLLVHGIFHICRTNVVKGIGLAAVQVGVLQNIIVVNLPDHMQALINPIIRTHGNKKGILKEGCISHPGILVEIERYIDIEVSYQDRWGASFTETFTGLSARVIQHEIDHLHGINIIDK